jgi:pimeloyl-ACP methyl ester carboxylesterase
MEHWWHSIFPDGRKTTTITESTGQTIEISYGEKGQGPPLILFHGIGSWSYSWRKLIDPLAQQFRVICFDAKGHGFSARGEIASEIGYQVPEFIQIVRLLAKNQPVVVMAQSLGALITLAAVEAEPQLFSHLVLMNVPIFIENLPNWWMPLIANIPINLIQGIDDLRLSKTLAPLIQKGVTYLRREVVVDPQAITPEEVAAITYPYIEFPGAIATYANDLQLGLQALTAKAQNRSNLMTQVEENLDNILQPTLILWGDRDRWFPSDRGELLYQNLQNADFKILNQCGHDAAATAPTQIHQELQNFLQKYPYLY